MASPTSFLFEPNVRLYGPIEHETVRDFLQQLQKVRGTDNPLVLELSTEGGDADAARRIALEVRLCRKWYNRPAYFVGKTVVMSAGITIMAAFPRECRFLTDDAVLLIHERRITKTVELKGPIRSNIQIVSELLAQFETAEKLERDGFAELAHESAISADELYTRATKNFYLTAQEALKLRLIAEII